MTQSDKIWLKTTFQWDFIDKPFEHPYIPAWYEAERILKGYERIIPLDCNCKGDDLVKEVKVLFHEFIQKESLEKK